jgi:hypothetical protein
LLGRPIELMRADDQNKADIASALARLRVRPQQLIETLRPSKAAVSGRNRPAAYT